LGLSSAKIGMLLSLTLVGDIVVSLVITTRADRVGRRRMLILGAALVAIGGVLFAATDSFALLLMAATIAVISPSGGEVGPFLPIEQAALAQIVPPARRMDVFAWYNLVGSVATAFGALAGGLLVQGAQLLGLGGASSFTPVLVCYSALGGVLAVLFLALSPSVEPARAANESDAAQLPSSLGLHRSRPVVIRLSALFALDAFGGGFIMQSILAFWLHKRFGIDAAALGAVFFGANLLAGVSALAAGWLSRHIGLLHTMVFTHLPSNILLILVPLMPTPELAVTVLLLRFSISQMDVPTRQAYTMAVVAPDERASASGITTVARSIGAAISPSLATRLVAYPALMSMPFFLAGGIKIIYDLILWRAFASVSSEELEQVRGT
ncbi:MAG TPA: MFS transporter, partial [Pirellulales bacterium]|nr:MFS transporter [Pirellulales bacterium]